MNAVEHVVQQQRRLGCNPLGSNRRHLARVQAGTRTALRRARPRR